MEPWHERPIEEANLLNPAFCSLVLSTAAHNYRKVLKTSFPYPLAYMVLPIVLHKTTRESLPRSISTSLPVWLQKNMEVRIQFAARVRTLRSHTREAILLGYRYTVLTVDECGAISSSLYDAQINKYIKKASGEARECIMKAGLVGRWFGSSGSISTIMALWGIRP